MKLKKLFDFFPPPAFLDVPYAGLSISDTSIRCIQFERNSAGSLYVKRWGERSITPGSVVSGYIQNQEEIVNILSKLKKDLNLGYIKTSLPEEKAYLFTTKIPRVDAKKVRDSIEFTIEDNVPLPASELMFDYAVADIHGHEDHVDVIVSALPSSIVSRYVETMQKAELPILSLEIESQAMVRALIPVDMLGTNLIVHFGHDNVGLYVAYKRIVHFTSTLAVSHDKGEYGKLSQEINKLYLYWHTLKENMHDPHKKITQIVVCGENVADEIVSHLFSAHKTPTRIGNVWVNAFDIRESIPTIPFIDSLRFGASVGLALPCDMLI